MATTTYGTGTNDTRFADLCNEVSALGKSHGEGKDSSIKFTLRLFSAAFDQVLDEVKDKHGTGIDDAVYQYALYAKAAAETTIFDHKSASGKVQASKARTAIKFGGFTRFGPGEPKSVVNSLMGLRHKMRQDPATRDKLDDPVNTFLRFARFQMKQNTVMDDPHTLRQFCLKPGKSTKDLETVLKGIAKSLNDVMLGKAAEGSVQDSSYEIRESVSLLKQRIADLKAAPVGTPLAEDNQ